jgi:hypothetical protein
MPQFRKNNPPAITISSTPSMPSSDPHTSHGQFDTPKDTGNESADVPKPKENYECGISPTSTQGMAKAASENATLKKAWDEVMIDLGPTGKPHRKVAVLMLSWAEELDDLHTQDEVNEL